MHPGRATQAALSGAIGLVAAASILSLLGRHAWLFDLLTFARQHLLVLAMALALTALVARRPQHAALAAAAAAVNGLLVLATVEKPVSEAPAAGERLRVLSLNLLSENYYTGRMERFFRRTGADVLVLQEVSPYWGIKLDALRDRYPHVWPGLVPFAGEIVVMSRFPFANAETLPISKGIMATPWARPVRVVLEVGAARVSLYGLHPDTPRSSERWRRRNDELGWIAELMAHRDEPGPRIVAGDFNASPWSPFMRDFIRVAGLRDASGGGLREPTRQPMFLSPYLSWLGAPVDHLLVSPDVAVRSFSIGRHVESDHLPIIADLQLAGAGERDQSSGIKPAR